MRLPLVAFVLGFPIAAAANEKVPAGGFPLCTSQKELQALLTKSLDPKWNPPGDLDCIFLKAGLDMTTLREIKGASPVGRVLHVRVKIPGGNKTVEGYAISLK